MSKYDKMIEENQRKSKEKIELALQAIQDMLANKERISVPKLMKKTGLSRGFFYKNPTVRDTLNQAVEQQAGMIDPRSDAAGFASAAQAYYNTKTDEHILRICKSSEIPRYIVFHEFTHILDTEMYAKQDSWKYMALSGYTEYHAAQVELMIMLGADSIQTQDFSFTVDVEIGNSTVRNYLNSRHQLVVNMMNRTDFPRDIEALKTTVGVLYNYFGVRSICKMYAKDYTEEVDNTIIIQKLSKVLFEEINSFMVGWFNEAQVELSFVSYMKIMWPMLQSYFGKE